MRWIKFSIAGTPAYGILQGDRIVEVEGDMLGSWKRTGRTHGLAGVKIEIPLIPRTFYAAGFNYAVHVGEASEITAVSAAAADSRMRFMRAPENGKRENRQFDEQ